MVLKYFNSQKSLIVTILPSFLQPPPKTDLTRLLENRYKHKDYKVMISDYNNFNILYNLEKKGLPEGFHCDWVVPQLSTLQSNDLCTIREWYFTQFNLNAFKEFVLWIEKRDDDLSRREKNRAQLYYAKIKQLWKDWNHNKILTRDFFIRFTRYYFNFTDRKVIYYYTMFHKFYNENYISISEYANPKLTIEQMTKRYAEIDHKHDGYVDLGSCDLFVRINTSNLDNEQDNHQELIYRNIFHQDVIY